MSKKFLLVALLVLLALVAFTVAQEAAATEAAPVQQAETQAAETEAAKKAQKKKGKKWTEKKCLRFIKVRCEYFTACKQAKKKCVKKSKPEKVCKQYKERTVRTKKSVCLQEKWVKKSKDCNELVKRCVKTGFKTEVKKQTYCAKHYVRRVCLERKDVCVKRKLVKRCWYREPKMRLTGPKKCGKGQVLKFTKKTDKHIVRSCQVGLPEPTKQCYSFMDPHHFTYKKGYYWDLQAAGDWIFAETADHVFALHYRTQMHGSWAKVVGFAAKVNGLDVVEFVIGAGFKLNGRALALPANGEAVEFKQGGSIKLKGSEITITAPNGITVLVRNVGWALDVFINTPVSMIPTLRGVCQDQKLAASGIFGTTYVSQYMDTVFEQKKHTQRQISNAKALCEGQGVKGPQLAACIKDVLMTGKRNQKMIAKLEGGVRKEIRHAKKIATPEALRQAKAKLAVKKAGGLGKKVKVVVKKVVKKAAPKKVVKVIRKVVRRRGGKKVVKRVVRKVVRRKPAKKVRVIKKIIKRGRKPAKIVTIVKRGRKVVRKTVRRARRHGRRRAAHRRRHVKVVKVVKHGRRPRSKRVVVIRRVVRSSGRKGRN